VGEATYRGLELALSVTSPTLAWGGNYSHVVTSMDNPNDATARLTTTPRNKALLWGRWQPTPELSVMPNLEYSGARWSSAATGTGYTKLGAYPLGAEGGAAAHADGGAPLAARNLLDRNYATTAGYPQEGRNFVLTPSGASDRRPCMTSTLRWTRRDWLRGLAAGMAPPAGPAPRPTPAPAPWSC
jgi:iron complex outermembrane receptor protein